MLEVIILAILIISFFLHPILFIAEIFLLIFGFLGYAFWAKRSGHMNRNLSQDNPQLDPSDESQIGNDDNDNNPEINK